MSKLALSAPTLETLPGELRGRALFDGTTCLCGDAIQAGDLVAANFDVKDVHTGGGLYLLEARDNGQVTWRGCRRMMRTLTGIAIDQNGQGDWITVPNLNDTRWRVVGIVESVYRRVSCH